jgi:hypothetical protein
MEMGSSYVRFYNSLSYFRLPVNPLIHSEDLGVEKEQMMDWLPVNPLLLGGYIDFGYL